MQHQRTILDNYQSIIVKYFEEAEKCEYTRIKENKMATKIQSSFRKYVKRTQFLKIKYSCIFIQKFARGFLARLLMKRNSDNRYNARNIKYFSYLASLIQKTYRGYIYRKYQLNWSKRKEFLTFLKKKNETFLLELRKVEEEEVRQLQAREEQLAKSEFQYLARNLHHLTSTKSISGIYNRPYGNKDIVFGMDIESHLQIVFHSNYKWERSKQMSRYSPANTKKRIMSTKLSPLS